MLIAVFCNGTADWIITNSQMLLVIPTLINAAVYLFQSFSGSLTSREKVFKVLTGITTSINMLPCLSLLILTGYSIKAGFRGSGILGIIFVPIGSFAMIIAVTLAFLIGIGIPILLSRNAEEKKSTGSLILTLVGMAGSTILTFLTVKLFVSANFSHDAELLKNTIVYYFLQ